MDLEAELASRAEPSKKRRHPVRKTPDESGSTSRTTSSDRGAKSGAGTTIMQARVDTVWAKELLEVDAVVLGLDSASDLVREGLRLVHRRAQELAMAASYDDFYGGKSAPVSEVTAALWSE
jgi:hypothetical protein